MNDIFVVPIYNSDVICIIDIEDAEKIMKHRWTLTSNGYAYRNRGYGNRQKHVNMARDILELQDYLGNDPDHINLNKLDNRKINLRVSTRSQNLCNRVKQSNCSSKYKGVSFHKSGKRWYIYIRVNGRRISGGMFGTELEAAKAYNALAIKYHGEFAVLNTF
jgi:hypothetical protein